jgi:hypothetical protein
MCFVDRESMGKFTSLHTNVYQELDGVLLDGIWSALAYVNKTIYYGPAGDHLAEFPTAAAGSDPGPSSPKMTTAPGVPT